MEQKKNGTKHAFMSLVSMCVGAFAVSGLSFGGLSLFTDPVSQDLGILRTEFAVCITLATLLHAIVVVTIYGPIWKRIGTRGVLILGAVLQVLAFVCYSLANGVALLWTAGALQGVAAGFLCNATINTVIIYWFAKKQGLMLSIIRVVGNFSGTIGSMLIGFMLLNPDLGWRKAFIVLTVAIVLCMIIMIVLYKGDPDKLNETPAYYDASDGSGAGDDEYGYTAAQTRRMPSYWIMAIGFFLCGFATNGTLSILSPICNDMGDAALGSSALSLLWLVAAGFGILVGIACDKFTTRPTIIVTGILVAVGSLLLLPANVPAAVVYLAAVCLGAGYTSQIIPLGICVVEAFGNREYGDKNPLIGGMMVFGVAASPVVLNAFYDFGGQTYTLALILNAVVSIASIALILISIRKMLKPGEQVTLTEQN